MFGSDAVVFHGLFPESRLLGGETPEHALRKHPNVSVVPGAPKRSRAFREEPKSETLDAKTNGGCGLCAHPVFFSQWELRRLR